MFRDVLCCRCFAVVRYCNDEHGRDTGRNFKCSLTGLTGKWRIDGRDGNDLPYYYSTVCHLLHRIAGGNGK